MNRTHLSLLGCLLIGSLSALADPVEATFTGVNGAAEFGYFVGPYYGTLDGAPVTLYCVDFANEVTWGESWQANITYLNTTDLSNTRYGGAVGLPDALTRYEEAAYLTTQYALNPSSVYGDIQATIWQLFDANAPQPSSDYWKQLAADNYQTVDFSRFAIVTNVGPVTATGQVQEFLIDPAPVPEPSAIFLFATVLLSAAWMMRRRVSAQR